MLQKINYLLDTNIIIAMFSDEGMIQAKILNDDVFIAATVIGELRFGAQNSAKVAENHRRIDWLVQQTTILPCDLETAWWYGIIRDQMQRKGRPIPNNDIWIAAIAIQHDLVLVTRDSHFDEVDTLQVQRW